MKRIAFILVALFVLALIAGLLVYRYLSRPAPRAVDLLGDTTLLFIDVPDFTRARAKFHDTELFALCHEPEVQALLGTSSQTLSEQLSLGLDAQTRDLIVDAMRGEVFLAVTGVTVLPNFRIGLVFGADVKRNRLQTEAALYKLEKQLRLKYPQAHFEKKSRDGVTYSVWEIRPGYPICQLSLNSLILFTLGEEPLLAIIDRHAGKTAADSSLGRSAPFRAVAERMPADHELLAYVNVNEIVGLIGPFLAFAPQSSGMMKKLARVQAAGSSVTFTDRGVHDVSVVNYREPDPHPASPVTGKTMSLTSSQTIFYAAASTDWATGYDELMQSLSQAGNTALAEGAVKFERTIRSRGVRIRDDVLAHIGPETATLAAWREGARFPNVAFAAEITPTGETRAALDTAMNALKEVTLGGDDISRWEESETDGATLRTVRIAGGLIAPTYTVADGFLLVGLTPDYVRELLTRDNRGEPTLAGTPQYDTAVRRLPGQAVSYTYCDLPHLFTRLYAPVREIAAAAGDASKLPATDTIARHLSPYVSAQTIDGATQTTTAYSALGRPVTLLGGAALAYGAVAPYLPQWGSFMPAIGGAPRTSSSTDAAPPAPENQTEASETPTPR